MPSDQRPETHKTVFISYRRRQSWQTARLIYSHLRAHDYDVFMDVESIDSGQFDTIIRNQIAARAHFLVVLGPGSMEGFDNPQDWLRQEIEHAISLERNIIPILEEGFKFEKITPPPGRLQELPRYNALTVPHEYFDAAMQKLRERYLRKPVQGPIQATPEREIPAVEQRLEKTRQEIARESAREDPKPSPGAPSARPRVESRSAEAPAGMVKVPKGPFLYGEDRHRETIDHDYWIGIYPVTNEEFRAFILAGGYENQAYWSQEGWRWKTEENIRIPASWNNPKFIKPDHPVVGVSFHEAQAYATWARKRLPTEQEWEKAARGTDGRIYPWGDEFDKNKCNSLESRLDSTSPVSKYPEGVSPYGCYDMAGNVGEWCAVWYEQKQLPSAVRGGAWCQKSPSLRAWRLFHIEPGGRDSSLGFRLVQDISE
ncbi:TIR domain-containing protein [Nitrospira tepida]|uniref:TIR domain-containing protein n=1 Tax=Nitrospira tepida TaxID=2973512 RepID=A0AA86T3L7_9BACT|nr:SUMF1/EgtB/PvdO family nonheme iron enzyme [Nitrospira tepida]CAI4031355.1 TIR domain-containing protein [Nitrospira tepida]